MSTTFTVTARRSGEWWAVEVVEGLDADTLGVTQTRHLVDVEQAARDVIADLTGLTPTRVAVDVL